MKLLLVTTAVDPRQWLSAFPSIIKTNVKVQLKLNVKKHICFAADQIWDSPVLPLEKLKPLPSVYFDQKKSFQATIFSLCYN